MNCQECLAELATGSLRDLTPESDVMRHCATCADCGPLATMLRDREYNAASVLNNLPPMSNPISIAETAGMLARRRRVGKVAVFLSGAALVVTVLVSVSATQIGRHVFGLSTGPALHTETIQLSCLSPQQAGDIISPYVRSNGSAYYVTNSSNLSVITVRGTADELAKSRELIRQLDADPHAACRFTVGDKLIELQDQVERAVKARQAREAVEPRRAVEPPADGAPVLAAPKK